MCCCVRFVRLITGLMSTPSTMNSTTVKPIVKQGHCSAGPCAQSFTHKVLEIKISCGGSLLWTRTLSAVIACCGNDAIFWADLPKQWSHCHAVTQKHHEEGQTKLGLYLSFLVFCRTGTLNATVVPSTSLVPVRWKHPNQQSVNDQTNKQTNKQFVWMSCL